MSRSLLDITDDLRALDALLYEIEGDISDPKVAQIVDEFFAELDGDLRGKVDNYAAYITELTGRAAIRQREGLRLMQRAQIDERTAEFLKARLKWALEERGLKTLETSRYRVGVASNGGKQPINVYDADAVPRDFCRHVPERWEPDKELIREAIERVFWYGANKFQPSSYAKKDWAKRRCTSPPRAPRRSCTS